MKFSQRTGRESATTGRPHTTTPLKEATHARAVHTMSMSRPPHPSPLPAAPTRGHPFYSGGGSCLRAVVSPPAPAALPNPAAAAARPFDGHARATRAAAGGQVSDLATRTRGGVCPVLAPTRRTRRSSCSCLAPVDRAVRQARARRAAASGQVSDLATPTWCMADAVAARVAGRREGQLDPLDATPLRVFFVQLARGVGAPIAPSSPSCTGRSRETSADLG